MRRGGRDQRNERGVEARVYGEPTERCMAWHGMARRDEGMERYTFPRRVIAYDEDESKKKVCVDKL